METRTHIQKAQENYNQVSGNKAFLSRSAPQVVFPFTDKRSEMTSQRKTQEIINNSAVVQKLNTIQKMANCRPQTKPATRHRITTNDYFRPTTQRKENSERETLQGKADTAIQKSGMFAVVQFGGTNWQPYKKRTHISKLGTRSGITAHYTHDGANFYIEGWIEGEHGGECAGEVQIVPGDPLALHTKSEGSSRGGLGDKLMPIALKTVAKNHNEGKSVLLPMGGGAVIKLIIGSLSEVFGVPEIHEIAKESTKIRKAKQKKELLDAGTEEAREKILEDRKSGVSAFNPDFLEEHGLHLNALLSSDKGKRIQIISSVYVKIEPMDTTEMSIQDHLKRVIEQPAMNVILPMDLFIEYAESL